MKTAKEFWKEKSVGPMASAFAESGWVNVYNYFSDTFIWPRGYPLEELQKNQPELKPPTASYCPIQQGLADENPDDQKYRRNNTVAQSNLGMALRNIGEFDRSSEYRVQIGVDKG